MPSAISFLSLPGEIRNKIYHLVVEQAKSLTIRGKRIYHSSALAYTCKAVRREYEPIYTSEAMKYASRLNIHYTGFDWGSAFGSAHYVRKSTQPIKIREEKHHIHLGEGWTIDEMKCWLFNVVAWNPYPVEFEDERCIERGIPWAVHYASERPSGHFDAHYTAHGFPFTIHFDYDTFDVEECRRIVRTQLGSVLTRGHTRLRTSELKFAFDKAFAGYDAWVDRRWGVKRKAKTIEQRFVAKRMRKS